MKARLKAAAAASAWILLITFLLIIKYADNSACVFLTAAVTEKTEISGSQHLTFDIRIPVISGLDDKAFERALNDSIERQVNVAKEDAIKAADEHWRRTSEEGFEPWPYAFYAEYDVKSRERILSLKVTTLLYTGGPGMPHSVYYNIDTEKNTLLTLGDLFKDDSYKEKIDPVIIGEMAKNTERYIPASDFKGVSDDTQFFISKGRLVITFAKYEVASGAAGEPEFMIPTEEIRGIVKEEYREVFK